MILLLGCNGSMGKRYSAILKYLNIDFIGLDLNEYWPKDFDKAIVATPTGTHYEICKQLINIGKPFLCEKPVSKSVEECEQLNELATLKKVDCRMVCNWVFIKRYVLNIYYNNYNTGKDGLDWDCIQLHYLSIYRPVITTNKPYFECTFDGVPISLGEIEQSYIKMIDQWMRQPCLLWSLGDAIKATKKVKGLL